MLGFICPLLTNSRFILNWLTELAQIMIFFSFFGLLQRIYKVFPDIIRKTKRQNKPLTFNC